MIYSHCHIVHSAAVTGLNAGQVWRRVLGSKSSKSCSCGVGLRVSKEGFEFEFGRHSPRLRHCANRDNSPTPHLWHTAVFTLHHSLSCQFNSHLHRHLNFDSELARLTMTILTRDCNIVGPQQPPPLDLDPHWQLICHSELAQMTRLTCAMLVDLLLSIFIHVHHGSATA